MNLIPLILKILLVVEDVQEEKRLIILNLVQMIRMKINHILSDKYITLLNIYLRKIHKRISYIIIINYFTCFINKC